MSSVYRLLCLAHDPAIVISGSAFCEWSDPAPAIQAALRLTTNDTVSQQHPDCPLMVGRYSGSLVELCCPAGHGDTAARHFAGGMHVASEWVDVLWLRLLWHSLRVGEAGGNGELLQAAWAANNMGCWPSYVLHRLRYELQLVES